MTKYAPTLLDIGPSLVTRLNLATIGPTLEAFGSNLAELELWLADPNLWATNAPPHAFRRASGSNVEQHGVFWGPFNGFCKEFKHRDHRPSVAAGYTCGPILLGALKCGVEGMGPKSGGGGKQGAERWN